MKLIVLFILVAVIVSLGASLFFLVRDGQGSARVLAALKVRVALSALLIGLMVVSYYIGWLMPSN
jgi:hypothetical protein